MFGVGDISRAFSGLAHGIGGLGRKIKQFGEEDDSQAERAALPITTTFNPTQSLGAKVRQGLRGVEDAVAAAEEGAREDFGSMRNATPVLDSDLPDLPINRRDLPIAPPPMPTPSSMIPARGTVLPNARSLRGVTPAGAAAPASSAGFEGLEPEMDMDRRNIPIPSLPGHPGGPVSYNPVDAAKYDYTMAGAERDEDGNYTGRFKRDWKQTALSTLAGAARGYATTGDVGGAIGGAAAGAGGSLISPQAGREFVFDSLYRPELQSREARERAERDRLVADAINQAKLRGMDAETAESLARAKKLGEPTPRQSDPKIGINRRTGRREYFDANDPAQRALYDAYVEPKNPPRGQMRLGRNTQTGEIDHYDAADPQQAALFEPYQFPREEGRSGQPGGVLKQISEIKKLKRTAQNAWGSWSKENDPKKREDLRIAAATAQAAYNDEVATLGEAFPDLYETGGFTEANGQQGWAYYKQRQGGGRAQPQGRRGAAQPSAYKRNVNQLPPLR
jgi:hypothetical protein